MAGSQKVKDREQRKPGIKVDEVDYARRICQNAWGGNHMEFLQLSEQAQKKAYQAYLKAMDDDLNRDNVVTFEQFGQEANWDGLEFNEDGSIMIHEFPLEDCPANKRARMAWEITNGIMQCDRINAQMIANGIKLELTALEEVLAQIKALKAELLGSVSAEDMNALEAKARIYRDFVAFASAMQ